MPYIPKHIYLKAYIMTQAVFYKRRTIFCWPTQALNPVVIGNDHSKHRYLQKLKKINCYYLQISITNNTKLDILSFLCKILLLRRYSLYMPSFTSFGGWNPPSARQPPFWYPDSPSSDFVKWSQTCFLKSIFLVKRIMHCRNKENQLLVQGTNTKRNEIAQFGIVVFFVDNIAIYSHQTYIFRVIRTRGGYFLVYGVWRRW